MLSKDKLAAIVVVGGNFLLPLKRIAFVQFSSVVHFRVVLMLVSRVFYHKNAAGKGREALTRKRSMKAQMLGVLTLSALVLSACTSSNFGGTGLNLAQTDTSQNTSSPASSSKAKQPRYTASYSGAPRKKRTTSAYKSAPKVKSAREISEKTSTSQNAYRASRSNGGSKKRLFARTNRDALRQAFRPNSEFRMSTAQIENVVSARCRRILADTGIETEILRSPTLSGNVTTDKDFGIGASFDFIDLKRANLKEELALARCYRNVVTLKLSQLLVTSSQASTRAGYLAKARILGSGRGEFSKIKRSINNAVNNGIITGSRAAILRQHLSQARLEEAKARSEASRREIVDRILNKNFKDLDQNLITADRRIYDIEERMRTVDAIKIRGSINYNVIDQNGTPLVRPITGRSSGVTGKINLSIRLGAFSRRRQELERISRNARVEQNYEEESGTLWRINELAKSNKSMLSGLYQQRAQLQKALNEATRNSRASDAEFEEELVPARIRGRIDALSLRANLAGVNATIEDIKAVNLKLRFRG